MLTPETEFRARLEKKLNLGIEIASGEIIAGGAHVPNFENYQYRVGFLRALQQCLDLCIEVENDMQQ